MKTAILLRLAVAALAALAALSVQARQAAAATASAAGDGQPKAAAPAKPRDWPGCIRDTGTHIPDKDRHCLAVPGRSYDQEDIRRTGATTVGGALDKLDPSISVRGR